MADLVEVLFTSESSGSQWTNCAWDARTGTSLMTYKGGGAANPHALMVIKNDFLCSANSIKPLLHIWPVNSQDQVQNIRFVTPGRVSALAVSPDGNFIIGGVAHTIYVWQLCSGKMLAALAKHYQTINVIKFTDDGSHFISAAQDGSVLVWNFTKVVAGQRNDQEPWYTFTDNALPITDLHVGHSDFRALLYTVSLDRTCNIYDLASGLHLVNIVFNEPLQSVAVDALELSVYIGTTEGPIYLMNIGNPPRMKEYHTTKEDYRNCFRGSKGAVTCLSLSFDGETLASGGADKNVYLWNILSRQLIRTIPHKDQISNLFFRLTPRRLTDAEAKLTLIAGNLKRMMDSQETEDIVEILVTDECEDEYYNPLEEGVQRSSKADRCQTPVNQDLEELRNEVEKLKKINKQLFEYSVKHVLDEKDK